MAGYSRQGPYGLLLCYEGNAAVVDIVFVHGLTGSRESTWTHKPSGNFWPRDLLKEEIQDSRIISFGYDADVGHFWSKASQNRVANHAQNLLNKLAQVRERSETNDRPIIFVAHSLGGLVVEDAILHSKNSAERHLQSISKSVLGIAFMGTPHLGSDLAKWDEVLKSFKIVLRDLNPEIVDLLKPESEVLARIQKEFHTTLRVWKDENDRDFKITCFYEELRYRAIGLIVPMHSAILPAYNSIGIRGDHVNMTKFASDDDPGFQSISNELWMWVKHLKETLSKLARSKGSTGLLEHPDETQSGKVIQCGNTIESGSHQSGSGTFFQGNNIASQKDITLNFGK